MRNSKTLLKMMIIVVLAASHAAEHFNMHIGEVLTTDYCVEDDEEDEEEIFERMHMISDTRRTRKIDMR
jgi:hypothetical protein